MIPQHPTQRRPYGASQLEIFKWVVACTENNWAIFATVVGDNFGPQRAEKLQFYSSITLSTHDNREKIDFPTLFPEHSSVQVTDARALMKKGTENTRGGRLSNLSRQTWDHDETRGFSGLL